MFTMSCMRRNARSTTMKGLTAAILGACLAVGMVGFSTQAASATPAKEGYSYRVTVSAGNGTIQGQPSVGYECAQGAEVRFVLPGEDAVAAPGATVVDLAEVQPPASNDYYVKGVRLAGQDKALTRMSFAVGSDAQYVVAYGIANNMVDYTVNYIDQQGNKLADSQQFKGNVGDKPVVAYRYIEGYQPNAYNLARTLSDDPAANVFDFKYTPIAGATDGSSTEDGSNNGTSLAVRHPVFIGSDDADEDGNDGTGDEGAAEEATEPAEIIDLDEDETPLAAAPAGNGVQASEAAMQDVAIAPIVAGIAGVLAVLALLVFILRRRTKKGAEQES